MDENGKPLIYEDLEGEIDVEDAAKILENNGKMEAENANDTLMDSLPSETADKRILALVESAVAKEVQAQIDGFVSNHLPSLVLDSILNATKESQERLRDMILVNATMGELGATDIEAENKLNKIADALFD